MIDSGFLTPTGPSCHCLIEQQLARRRLGVGCGVDERPERVPPSASPTVQPPLQYEAASIDGAGRWHCMRKALTIVWGVWRNGTDFDPDCGVDA